MNRISQFLLGFTFVVGSLAQAADYVQGNADQDRVKPNYIRIQQWDNNYQDSDKTTGREQSRYGWSPKSPNYVRYRSYHGTMGTQLIPIKWFAALETLEEDPAKRKLLADPAVYESFGFIESDVPEKFFPEVDGINVPVPIGFAVSIDEKAELKFGEKDWLGLNCAGCHTTKMNIAGKDVIIDGNATMFRLNQFEFTLEKVVKETITKRERFIRFANRVKNFGKKPGKFNVNEGVPNYSKTGMYQGMAYRNDPLFNNLRKFYVGLRAFLKNNHIHPRGNKMPSGETCSEKSGCKIVFSPGSVDALTLGGNMAAGCNRKMWEDPRNEPTNLLAPIISRNDFYEKGNCQPADVPVNIPHIWATNNFSGGHYAAEETNVTGRNFGAAMTGFGANRLLVKPKLKIDLTLGDDIGLFSIDKDNLLYPETSIKLRNLDQNQKWYDTLKAPTWQKLVEAGVVDPMSDDEIQQAKLGQEIYQAKCSSCHGDYQGDVSTNGRLVIKPTEANEHGAQFWDLVRVPTDKDDGKGGTINVIGTDLARNRRDGIESNKTLPEPLVDKFNEIFAEDKTFKEIDPDGPRTVAARFYRQFWVLATLRTQIATEPIQGQLFSPTTPKGFEMLMGCRDINELRSKIVVANAYKARPLDGIVFTGPYLHNGSVPTLWDLFSPSSRPAGEAGPIRPATFEVGCTNYDIEKMGFVCDSQSDNPAKSANVLPFDIKRYGQKNVGHEDDSLLDPNVYGSSASFGTDLSAQEKLQLITFLKTLETPKNPSRGICEFYTYHD